MLYSFRFEINMNVSATISRTKCKPVNIDPCLYYLSRCKSVLNAKDYLQSITQLSELQLIPNDFISEYGKSNYIFFDASNIECSIVQIGSRYPSYKLYTNHSQVCLAPFFTRCTLNLSPIGEGMTIAGIKGVIHPRHNSKSRTFASELLYLVVYNYNTQNRVYLFAKTAWRIPAQQSRICFQGTI